MVKLPDRNLAEAEDDLMESNRIAYNPKCKKIKWSRTINAAEKDQPSSQISHQRK